MSKRQPSPHTDMALSPYLSLRQAVRPAIFAHSVMLREKDRSGVLRDEANRILAATRELLSKAGLGYLATPDSGTPMEGIGRLGNQTSLLDAFTDAAMLWAEVVASCVALAEHLLEQGKWPQVRTLTAVLEDAGEARVAGDLRERLATNVQDCYRHRLEEIHDQMSFPETQNAISTLTEVLSEVPESRERNRWLGSFLPAVTVSALRYITDPYMQGYLGGTTGRYMVSTDVVEDRVAEISAALRVVASGNR